MTITRTLTLIGVGVLSLVGGTALVAGLWWWIARLVEQGEPEEAFTPWRYRRYPRPRRTATDIADGRFLDRSWPRAH